MIVLVGVMASLATPAITGLRQAGQDQQAISIAQALNQAQQTYQLRVANAVGNWSNAGSSELKYELISVYVPFAAPTLANYAPVGYSFTLGAALSTKVLITGANGAVPY